MKRTPFYFPALQAGAVMREAQGWEMPDHFGDPRGEHLAARSAAALFDWSSTGEIEAQGPDALALVQRVIVNDAATTPVGRVLYTTMCNPDGSIFSDITVYRLGPSRYWLMTAWGSNRAGQRPEFERLVEHAAGLDVCVTDVSSGLALLAVQGPAARAIVARVAGGSATWPATLRYMDFVETTLAGAPRVIVSRTGYSGESGYELAFPAEYGNDVWEALRAAGLPLGMRHAGLETAFSLRMEKGYIARFDFMDGVTPLEAGLGWTVKFAKGDFIGREALLRQRESGVTRKLVSVALLDGFVPPYGAAIVSAGAVVGKVTSSAYGHAVGRPLGLALLPAGLSEPGTSVEVDAGGVLHPASVVRRPYYDPEGARLRA